MSSVVSAENGCPKKGAGVPFKRGSSWGKGSIRGSILFGGKYGWMDWMEGWMGGCWREIRLIASVFVLNSVGGGCRGGHVCVGMWDDGVSGDGWGSWGHNWEKRERKAKQIEDVPFHKGALLMQMMSGRLVRNGRWEMVDFKLWDLY